MPNNNTPHGSLPPESRTKMQLEAYTDWFAIASITLLTALDKIPWEWGLGIIASVAGVTSVLKGLGKNGGATALLIGPIIKAIAGKHGIHLLVLLSLSGCAGTGVTAGQAVKALLPVAAEALRGIAEKEGVSIDENGAACFEVPEIQLDLPEFEGVNVVALVCVAPYLEE